MCLIVSRAVVALIRVVYSTLDVHRRSACINVVILTVCGFINPPLIYFAASWTHTLFI